MTKTTLFFSTAGLFLMCLPFPAAADWSVTQNPVNGNAEAVWSTPIDQSTASVHYSYLDGSSWAPSTTVGLIGKIDTAPVLAFDANGDRTIVWQTPSDAIVLRTQAFGTSSWSSELSVSDSSETAANPSVTVYDDTTYVSYETTPTLGGRSVKVAAYDPGSNFERTVVSTTSSASSPLLSQLHTEVDHLWVEWIDSDSSMGYSEWTDGNWTSASYESYSGSDDIKEARDRIRDHVVTGQ